MGAFKNWFTSDFRNRILAGIVVTVPLGAAFLVLRFVFRFMEGFASPFLRRFLQIDFPGLGILLTLAAVYAAGLFAANVVGKQIIHWIETSIVIRLPLVRDIYHALKKLTGTFSFPSVQSFRKVVLLEFPRPGIRTLGFVTGETFDRREGRRLVNVFVPTVPNPTSGILQLVPQERLIETDLSVEEGIRLIVSGGFLLGDQLLSREFPGPSA